MSLVTPSTAVDHALAPVFTFISSPSKVPDREESYSSAITAHKEISDRMEAAPPGSRSLGQSALLLPASITVNAKPRLRRPTNKEILRLFEKIHRNRPDFVFFPGDIHGILQTQLKWKVQRLRIKYLWRRVVEQKATISSSFEESPADDNESEQIKKSQSDIITSIISSSDKKTATLHESALKKQAAAEQTFAEQITLTCPSTIEVMTFLWKLEEDFSRAMENRQNLLMMLKWEKRWQLSEARIAGILMEMDEADADNVFDMPMANTHRSSYQSDNVGASFAPAASPKAVPPTTAAAKDGPAGVVPSVLAPALQRPALRNAIRTRVLSQRPEHASKITEMLLELKDAELARLSEDDDALYVIIEGLYNLYVHYTVKNTGRAESGTADLALERSSA